MGYDLIIQPQKDKSYCGTVAGTTSEPMICVKDKVGQATFHSINIQLRSRFDNPQASPGYMSYMQCVVLELMTNLQLSNVTRNWTLQLLLFFPRVGDWIQPSWILGKCSTTEPPHPIGYLNLKPLKKHMPVFLPQFICLETYTLLYTQISSG